MKPNQQFQEEQTREDQYRGGKRQVMRMKSNYEELKTVDDTGSVGGGGYGNPQPQKPNEDWVKWIIFGLGILIIAFILASALK